MRVGRTSVQRALAVRKEGCRPRGRPTYVPVRVSGQMPVSSFRVRGGQQGVPSWEEGGGSAGSGVLVRGAPGTESQVRAATQHPRLCLQGSCRRGRGLRGEGVACARPGTAPPRRWLSPCAFGGLHGVQEAGQGGVGSPPSRKSAPWGRGFPQPGVSCWPGGGARTMGPVGAAPWLSGLPLETPELRSLSVCRVLRGGARSPWNSWLFYCIGKETLKACKTALLCPCHGDGAGERHRPRVPLGAAPGTQEPGPRGPCTCRPGRAPRLLHAAAQDLVGGDQHDADDEGHGEGADEALADARLPVLLLGVHWGAGGEKRGTR